MSASPFLSCLSDIRRSPCPCVHFLDLQLVLATIHFGSVGHGGRDDCPDWTL